MKNYIGQVARMRNGLKKALIVTTVSGFVPQFEMNNVRILQQMGYEVHYASNYNTPVYGTNNHRLKDTGIKKHQIDFVRSPFHLAANIKAYRQLSLLIIHGNYQLIHCHTPMGGVLARIAAWITNSKIENKKKIKIIYTAHGFHFYKGAPLKNWLLFYPVEFILANVTNVLITINSEDYNSAKKFCKYKNTVVKRIPGVGIDIDFWSGNHISNCERELLRNTTRTKLGINKNEIAFLSVGELIPRKNHEAVIRAILRIIKNKNVKTCFRYYICGDGCLYDKLNKMIQDEHAGNYIKLLGYQSNIRDIMFGMDAFIFPSLQEGLPVALMEAIAAGLPAIASDIRGNRELAGDNDILFCLEKEKDELINAILAMIKRLDNKKEAGYQQEKKRRIYKYDKKVSETKMKQIYSD